MSVRRFDGWEPRQVTRHRYDRQGRLVTSTTEREPEWDAEQQGWMLALALYESQVHKNCGGYLPDTTAAEADGKYRADLPIRCHKCDEHLRIRDVYEAQSTPRIEALLWPVRRRG